MCQMTETLFSVHLICLSIAHLNIKYIVAAPFKLTSYRNNVSQFDLNLECDLTQETRQIIWTDFHAFVNPFLSDDFYSL